MEAIIYRKLSVFGWENKFTDFLLIQSRFYVIGNASSSAPGNGKILAKTCTGKDICFKEFTIGTVEIGS